MNPAAILISLSSFGASEVLQHGQLHYTRLAQAAGADGVEVRGELLASEAELPALAATGMVKVFSSPTGLWTDEGRLDLAALELGLATAARLGATRLKMAIGGFAGADELPALSERLARSDIELVIENDQTPSAGTVSALQRFFAAADAAGLDLGLVFDMGNWHWLGECPQQAAAALGARVRYVHCKGVQRERSRWIAVPMADSAAPWRAVLRALPRALPWAIEYPLQGEDLPSITRSELGLLQEARAQA